MFKIEKKAEEYIANLFRSQEQDDLALRIDIEYAGTPQGMVTFRFCNPSELGAEYKQFSYEGFEVYIDEQNFDYLEDSDVAMSGEVPNQKLTIAAPKAKGSPPDENASLEEKIRYTIVSHINPQLASHGGFVELIEMSEQGDIVLNFGGGCQGCSSVSYTLKNAVESQLKGLHPEIKSVRDVTDHSDKTNAYFT